MTSAVRNSPSPTAALERRLITVASGKGGVGKTWFSVSLAHALARLGKKVLLFDGDLGLANVDIQLGLTPERDLGDVISGRHRLRDVITRFGDDDASHTGFDVIAGKSGSGALSNIARERLTTLRGDLIAMAADYDHVILDLAAGVDNSVTSLSNHQGATLVILTSEPTSLTDAYAFIKLRRMRDIGADIRVIVNQAADRREGEATYETLKKACAAFLKFSPPLSGVIRRDPKVTDAIRHQTPLLARHPQAEASQNIETIAKALLAASRRPG